MTMPCENMDGTPASIIIPVFNRAGLTLRCLESLAQHTPEGLYEVIVVDNGSTDTTPELLASLDGDVRIITNAENVGYTLACNQGAERAEGRYLVFLNNDTEPQPGWLQALLAAAEADPAVGAVGARLVYPDGRLQEAGGLVFSDGSGWNFGRGDDPTRPAYGLPCEVDYCSGACLLVRADRFRELGGFDPRYAPAYYEDTDLCFGLRSIGAKVMYEPAAVVVHHEGGTAGTDLGSGYKRFQTNNRDKFLAKWADALATQDPPPTATGRAPGTADRGARGLAAPVPAASVTAAGPGLRVLVVDPFLPLHDRNSGSKRLFELLKQLRAQGHEVTYLARSGVGAEIYAPQVEALGITVHAGDAERLVAMGERPGRPPIDLDRILAEGRFDVAWLSFFDVGEQYLPILRERSPGTKIVIDTVDVHWLREHRQAELIGDPALFRRALETKHRERQIYRRADALVAITDADRTALAALAPEVPAWIVPNVHAPQGAGPEFPKRSGMLFVGNFLHGPNVDAVTWLIEDIMPKVHGLGLTVVGGNPPQQLVERAGPRVSFAGYVPDMTPYLDAARVSVAPLRYGAGMKGKIGEAMAAGLPVVTTPIGAEGMGLVDGMSALISSTAEGFAAAVTQLAGDRALWESLATNGRALVGEHWTPAAAGARVREVLEALCPAPGQVPAASSPALAGPKSS